MGDVVIEENTPLDNESIMQLLKENCSDAEVETFASSNELDCAVMLGDLRFRANFYKTLNGVAAVLRRV